MNRRTFFGALGAALAGLPVVASLGWGESGIGVSAKARARAAEFNRIMQEWMAHQPYWKKKVFDQLYPDLYFRQMGAAQYTAISDTGEKRIVRWRAGECPSGERSNAPSA